MIPSSWQTQCRYLRVQQNHPPALSQFQPPQHQPPQYQHLLSIEKKTFIKSLKNPMPRDQSPSRNTKVDEVKTTRALKTRTKKTSKDNLQLILFPKIFTRPQVPQQRLNLNPQSQSRLQRQSSLQHA